MDRMRCVDADIRPFNRASLAATAITAKAPDGDNLMMHKGMEHSWVGRILRAKGLCPEQQGSL